MKIKSLAVLVAALMMVSVGGSAVGADARRKPQTQVIDGQWVSVHYTAYVEATDTAPARYVASVRLQNRTDPQAYAEAVARYGMWIGSTLIPPAMILRIDILS